MEPSAGDPEAGKKLDPKHWRKRVEEARTLAHKITDKKVIRASTSRPDFGPQK
jgi:hypothetical protein